MRYFKVEIVYGVNSNTDHLSQTLYCCCSESFPKTEALRELFSNFYGPDKTYLSATWRQIREEDIPTDEIHLL